MEISPSDIMFAFYMLLGISIQIAALLFYPIYRITQVRGSVLGWYLLFTNSIWAIFVYYDIWRVFNSPDEWSLNSPGFVLAGYALMGPVSVWFVHVAIGLVVAPCMWAFNKYRLCAPGGAGRQNRCAVSPPLR